MLTAALLYFFFDARDTNNLFPKCPFYTITGFYCPGCGSQRAISALLHGDVAAAAGMNILLLVFLPFLVYAAVVSVVNSFRKKQLRQSIFYSPLFVKISLCLVLIFWVLRNIPQYPFTLLAPHSVG